MSANSATVLHVQPDQANHTLASVVRILMPGASWSSVRRAIRSRRVQVNGNLCTDDVRRLRAADVVKLMPYSLAPPPQEKDVRVRYLDADIVVVEKPSGMTSIRHHEERRWSDQRRQYQPTLDEVLPQIVSRKTGRRRRGSGNARVVHLRAVHRLDRDTSGLMVFARNVKAERALVTLFRQHDIHRSYLAVAHGRVMAQTVENFLVRDRGDGRRGVSKGENGGKRAVTHFRPVEMLNDFTVVECRLETGRTHQIRIHLAELGHFVCGDRIYCQNLGEKPRPDYSAAPRLALHAQELGFEHPTTGELMQFKSPLPADLEDYVNRLRKGV